MNRSGSRPADARFPLAYRSEKEEQQRSLHRNFLALLRTKDKPIGQPTELITKFVLFVTTIMEPAAAPYASSPQTGELDDPIKMEGGISHNPRNSNGNGNDAGKDYEPVPLVHHPGQWGSSHHTHHHHHPLVMDDSRNMMASQHQLVPQHLHAPVHHHLYSEPKKVSESKHQVWMEFYEKLKVYKRTYGNCVVPRGYEEPRLANWVCEQR